MVQVVYSGTGDGEVAEAALEGILMGIQETWEDLPGRVQERIRNMLRLETPHECMLAWARGRMSYRDLYAYREALEARGWVRVEEREGDGPGRPRKVWVWNPDLLIRPTELQAATPTYADLGYWIPED